jgi:hypothetical protein
VEIVSHLDILALHVDYAYHMERIYVSVSCDMLIFFWIHEFTLVYICLWIVEIDPTMIIYVWRLVPS